MTTDWTTILLAFIAAASTSIPAIIIALKTTKTVQAIATETIPSVVTHSIDVKMEKMIDVTQKMAAMKASIVRAPRRATDPPSFRVTEEQMNRTETNAAMDRLAQEQIDQQSNVWDTGNKPKP